MLTFMDMENYEQIELAVDFVGEDQAQFLQDGMKTLVNLYDGKPIGIKLPVQVTLTVAEADPVMKGGTAAPSYKTAVLENGLKIPSAALHQRRRTASSSPPKTALTSAGRNSHGCLHLPCPERDGRRRPQGRPPVDPRLQ